MPALRFRLVACSVVLCFLTQIAPPADAGQADGDGDGLVRTELTLNGRQVSVAYDPALRSDHRSLPVLRAGSTRAAVRLGRLDGHRSLAIGTLAPDPDEPRGPAPDHDLWLMRTAAGWVLDARPVEVEEADDASDGEDAADPRGEEGNENASDAAGADADAGARGAVEADNTEADSAEADSAEADSAEADSAEADAIESDSAEADAIESDDAEADAIESDDAEADADGEEAASEEVDDSPRPGRIQLAHHPRADEAETLAVELLPTGDATGELALVWGGSRWTADFEFVELPRPPRPPRTSDVSPGSSLTRDSDLEARYRATALGSRNETALVTPGGARIQVLFEQELGADDVDFAALESIGDGDLVQLTQGAVIRLRSEIPLRFGDTLIPTGNLAPDFPGSYGLWLRAAGSGWTLVFNNEPDSWGTQHDPAFDAAEIDVTHTHGGPYQDRPLAVSLLPVDDDEGRLVIHWGQHVWAADFTLAP